MDPKREQLIAWTLGELSPEDSRPLEAELAGDAELQAERSRLERTLTVIRAVPSEDVSDAVVARLLKAAAALDLSDSDAPVEDHTESAASELAPLFELKRYRVLFMRVAALVVIAFVFGLAVWFTPGGLPESVAKVSDDAGSAVVLDGDLVESRSGVTRRISFPTGEVLMDGASAVRVTSTGQFSPPSFEVERGRVVVTATRTPVSVCVAGREVRMATGAMLAVNYDRAYANIAADGSIVEIQRMPIGEVAALAEQAYGIKLNSGALPENVARQRITFYGSNLDVEAFVDSFIESASAFGVALDDSRSYLRYESRSGRVLPNEEWQLDIAVLEGSASIHEAETAVQLGDTQANFVTLSAARAEIAEPQMLDVAHLDRQVVWAAGAGGALGERLHDVKPSAEALPSGSVIHTDSLVLNGEMGKRIYKLGGDFDFPLPGGRRGRLVQLTSSGAVFEIQNEVVRELVPFGK